jgi:hypothetical protein
MDVAAWLHDQGFDRYARMFEDNDIDAEVLVTLTEADLRSSASGRSAIGAS